MQLLSTISEYHKFFDEQLNKFSANFMEKAVVIFLPENVYLDYIEKMQQSPCWYWGIPIKAWDGDKLAII